MSAGPRPQHWIAIGDQFSRRSDGCVYAITSIKALSDTVEMTQVYGVSDSGSVMMAMAGKLLISREDLFSEWQVHR